jgi:hypothetical protein
MTALALPGPRSLAMVLNRWAKSASRSFMAEQGRGDCFQEQDWLSRGIQVIINNPSETGAHKAHLVLDYPGFVGRTPK